MDICFEFGDHDDPDQSSEEEETDDEEESSTYDPPQNPSTSPFPKRAPSSDGRYTEVSGAPSAAQCRCPAGEYMLAPADRAEPKTGWACTA